MDIWLGCAVSSCMVFLEKLKLALVVLAGMEEIRFFCVSFEYRMYVTGMVLRQHKGRDCSILWIGSSFMVF